MKNVFAPGCALLIYKPELGMKVFDFLKKQFSDLKEHTICCKHEPKLAENTRVINICPGCDKRYRELYKGVSTVSLWEILSESNDFPFPDYKKKKMSILDACPTRDQARVHNSIRILLQKMNIDLIEPSKTREKGTCCGDNFFGKLPVEKVKEQMKNRASEMPCEDTVVYCVSCIKSMHIGGKKPRYLVDLLFQEETQPKVFEPDDWHKQVDEFINTH
ncbi:MAG: (Fe-S)-binding protein [Candidatus Riflebacteria bacterium]|nr:(Fe-S)-binding protein [Candidatus Riflebacteria bacterium]